MKALLTSVLKGAALCMNAQVLRTAGTFSSGTECMGVEGDGSQTVKAHGNGRHRWDAQEQARKNAVRDVIFNGIRLGKPECEVRPLVNAREKHEKYFNAFFQ